MTLPSEWKMGSCLEWYTEVPFQDRPRESPVFLIQNVECSFQLHREIPFGYSVYLYSLYLKPKTSDAKLKSFKFAIYCNSSSTGSLSRNDVNFSDSNQRLLYFWEENVKKRGANVGCGYFKRFLFVFGTGDGPSLPVDTKSEYSSKMTMTSPLSQVVPKSQNASEWNKTAHLEALSRDLSELSKESSSCDVEIRCGGETFQAHRVLLAARSSVFSAMLKSNMAESETGLIKLEDIKAPIFKSLLVYLYSGTLPEMNMDTALQFYEVADKYAVKELQKACSEFLTDNLSEGNACEALVLAELHSDEEFRKNVISYIVDKKIPQRDERWPDFSQKHPILAIEVMNLYVQKY